MGPAGPVLSLEKHAGRARDFLVLAMEHDHETHTVKEAALHLRLTRQHLHRQSLGWFGFPPGVMIDLRRAVSVCSEILNSPGSLGAIAAAHRFPDLSAMGRLTLRFVGLRPAMIRRTPSSEPIP